ncbi:SRPBCC domain-containing protein [uncultured Friedmanniella sp.]|uniref:SRPBCC domain-containing protein n=1 Tax=uncultured Friedmanniella sp. TaxID=335381 RepID=UPI0035CB901E
MSLTAHVYQIYLAASPEQVWTAITDSEWTRRWFHGTAFAAPPEQGQTYRALLPDGSPAVEGVVVELQPPAPGVPGRFVQTWHVCYDEDLAAEPPGRVEWTVEEAGDHLTRLRLVHGDLHESPQTWAHVRDGWVWVLDSLKTVLETGRPLPAAVNEPAPVADGDAAWHRRQGVTANNATRDLLARSGRDAEADERLLRAAYTAAYHWERAAGAGPENEARASYMIARALLATGQAAAALASAERILALCRRYDLVDFDLAYGHEARARALAALNRSAEAATEWTAARAVPVADPEDRAIVERDFADHP